MATGRSQQLASGRWELPHEKWQVYEVYADLRLQKEMKGRDWKQHLGGWEEHTSIAHLITTYTRKAGYVQYQLSRCLEK